MADTLFLYRTPSTLINKCTHTHMYTTAITTITDSSSKVYAYPTPRVEPGSATLTAAGGVLCGLLGVGIGKKIVEFEVGI